MDKLFVGNVEVAEGQYGKYTKIGFSKKDLELMTQHLNANGYVNLTLSRNKEGKPYITIYQAKKPEVRPEQTIIDPGDVPF